jgi:ferredoxin
MSKAHRGKGIRELVSHGRGVCPVCNRENVKVLYEQEAGGTKLKLCKTCRAAVKHGKKSLASSGAESEEAKTKAEAGSSTGAAAE